MSAAVRTPEHHLDRIKQQDKCLVAGVSRRICVRVFEVGFTRVYLLLRTSIGKGPFQSGKPENGPPSVDLLICVFCVKLIPFLFQVV